MKPLKRNKNQSTEQQSKITETSMKTNRKCPVTTCKRPLHQNSLLLHACNITTYVEIKQYLTGCAPLLLCQSEAAEEEKPEAASHNNSGL